MGEHNDLDTVVWRHSVIFLYAVTMFRRKSSSSPLMASERRLSQIQCENSGGDSCAANQ